MRIANAYENCKGHINVPRETMKRESKYVTNGRILTDTTQNIVTLEQAWGAPKKYKYVSYCIKIKINELCYTE